MKSGVKNRGRFLIWSLLLGVVIGAWVWVRQAERREMERLHPILKQIREQQSDPWHGEVKAFLATNPSATNSRPGSTRAANMTEREKADFARNFDEKFHPAVKQWLSAYGSHAPFNIEDFTPDKFHSILGSRMFTFIIDGMTLTLVMPRDPNQPAKVGYLMARKAALDMNRPPDKGFVPNLNLPVTREDTIRMVKTDSGVEFKPNEVIIRPTAQASALNGGAFVDILPTGKDPNNALNYVLSMVFGPDGKLVNYERDPRF